MSNRKLLVKFVHYNTKILEGLINKTVKYSTVYEFNDFNEVRLMSNCLGFKKSTKTSPSKLNIGWKPILREEIKKSSFYNNLLALIKNEVGIYKRDEIIQKINEELCNELPVEHPGLLLTNLVYSSIRMLCLSDLKVFDDDAAQLMFAHYANNLKGLALVYEYNIPSPKELHKMRYNDNYCNIPQSSSLNEEEVIKYLSTYDDRIKKLEPLCKGDNQDSSLLTQFLVKSKKWEYEKEYRLFSKDKIAETTNTGLELKAILYTTRFDGNPKTLLKVNEKFYDNHLAIKQINHSTNHEAIDDNGCYYFRICDSGEKVTNFLSKIIL